jgi:hypothetical protein
MNGIRGPSVFDLLRQALSLMKRNNDFSKQIRCGGSLRKISEPTDTLQSKKMEPEWWLERFFHKHSISFAIGALIIYLLKIIPTLIQLPMYSSHPGTFRAILTTLLGDLFIPISLILVHSLYKSVFNLAETAEKWALANEFVAPPVVICAQGLKTAEEVEKLDKRYSNQYIRPLMLKTFNQAPIWLSTITIK